MVSQVIESAAARKLLSGPGKGPGRQQTPPRTAAVVCLTAARVQKVLDSPAAATPTSAAQGAAHSPADTAVANDPPDSQQAPMWCRSRTMGARQPATISEADDGRITEVATLVQGETAWPARYFEVLGHRAARLKAATT